MSDIDKLIEENKKLKEQNDSLRSLTNRCIEKWLGYKAIHTEISHKLCCAESEMQGIRARLRVRDQDGIGSLYNDFKQLIEEVSNV